MGWGSTLQTGAVGVILVVAIFSMPAAAASNTDIILEPGEKTVEKNQTATYDVVVTNASRGVGAVEANISIKTVDVASAAGVTYEGNPSFASNRAAGDEIRFAATGMDTADNGTVTIGSVQFTGESAGTTTISLGLGDLSNEPGESYEVRDTLGAQLTVVESSDSSGSTGDDGGDDDSSSGSGGDVGGGGDSGGNGSASDRWMDDGDTETADNSTETTTKTEDEENETTTEPIGTEGGLEEDTAGPPDTESPDEGTDGFAPWQMVVFAVVLLLGVGGLIYGIRST